MSRVMVGTVLLGEVTETTFTWHGTHLPEPLRKAMSDWAERHGLDPNLMPMFASITRDVERCRVVCTYFVLEDDGSRRIKVDRDRAEAITVKRVAQGETPPMPWPDVVLGLMEAMA